jgi:hypothetical protein
MESVARAHRGRRRSGQVAVNNPPFVGAGHLQGHRHAPQPKGGNRISRDVGGVATFERRPTCPFMALWHLKVETDPDGGRPS